MAVCKEHPDFTFSELQRFLAFSPSAYFKWGNGPDYPVLHVSPSVEKVLGYLPETFYSGALCFHDLVHPEDLNRVKQELLGHKESPVFTHQPYRLKKADGT